MSKFLEELKKKIEAHKSPITVVNRGVTPLSLLGVAFIVLKVMGQITWSWWWVLAPFWIPVIIAILLCLFTISMIGIIMRKEIQDTVEKKEVEPEVPKKKTRAKKTKKDGEGGAVEQNEKGS